MKTKNSVFVLSSGTFGYQNRGKNTLKNAFVSSELTQVDFTLQKRVLET